MTTPWHFPSKLFPIFLAAAAHSILAAMAGQAPTITLPGCPDKCGNMSLPFPFGMTAGCFREGFEVTCNTSSHPPTVFLAHNRASQSTSNIPLSSSTGMPVQLLDISLGRSEARIYGAVASDCFTSETAYLMELQTTQLHPEGPFLLSRTRNVVTGVGLRAQPWLQGPSVEAMEVSCLTSIEDGLPIANGSCGGRGCCEAPIVGAPPIRLFSMFFEPLDNPFWNNTSPCIYGMVVESSWYNFSTPDLDGYKVTSNRFPKGVPMVLEFAIGTGSCPAQPPPDYACISSNSYCANATSSGQGYVCKCAEHYVGNPYIPDGCQDIDECELRKQNSKLREVYPCSHDGICKNKPGGYECPCKPGMKGDGKAGTCAEKFPLVAKVIVGAIGGLFIVAVIWFIFILVKEKKKTREFYERNGGPTLENARFIKLFKKEELNPFLKRRNFIGKGGFGEVYKGTVGNETVAIKKPISGSVLENEQFANEVIIQSQVIHKNIVRLIGCCLEVHIPMLVYEFISQGSLDDILHSTTKQKSLNLGQRLTIATESADGLAYMHSKANRRIIHGDVKPANILLDAEFLPKISDFGISRLIVRNIQHTESVIGDRSYMDPVYMQTGRLTEKSDVYSFGVLLLELICRKKATHSDNNSLVNNFLEAHKNKTTATDLFDEEISGASDLNILGSLAAVAVECLNLDVDQRPSMIEIEAHLRILSNNLVSCN